MVKRLAVSTAFATACAAAVVVSVSARPDTARVTVIDRPGLQRVDVLIDGKPFTSYIYPDSIKKPVLFPIRAASGAIVTRGYPLEPRPGEVQDHPHHVGHWFNYGDVNGYDFWGHSDASPAANKAKMGTIVHKGVSHIASSNERGDLTVRADWVVPDGSTLLREETRFAFSGGPARRVVDRSSTWTAAGTPVTFADTKEGAFGIRVARALDHPSPKNPAAGVTGRYIGSDGKTGDAVWGTRGPWMGLTGVLDGGPVTLAILDHPGNHGHPTYWHARGYGLFAANPLGRQGYDPKQPAATLTLAPGQAVTFRHRILVVDAQLQREQLQQEFDRYLADARR